MADRKGFIDSGVLSHGLNSSEMNNALTKAGFEPLSKIEASLIDSGKYGTTATERFVEGAKDIGAGLSTLISGVFTNPVGMAKEGWNYVTTNSLPDIMGDFYNAAARPLQLDSESLGTNLADDGVRGVLEGVVAGAVTNPADAAILSMPVIGRVGGKIAKGIAESKYTPEAIKKPMIGAVTERGREVNSILRDSKQVSTPTIDKLKAQNVEFKKAKVEDLEQAIKNVELGTDVGTPEQLRLTKELRSMTSTIEDMSVKAGFNKDLSKTSAVNQYITRKLQQEGLDIPVVKVEEALTNPEIAAKYGLKTEQLSALADEGSRLYDSGFIRPIKHSTTANTVREGLVTEAEKKVRGRSDKLYGTQSYKDVAEGIKAGAYDKIIKTIHNAEASGTALEEIVSTVGKKATVADVLASDEVLVSPRLLREKMGTSLAGGENINSALESLTRGLNKAETQAYSDDLFRVKKADLEALQNAYKSSNRSFGILGDLASTAKTVALGTPTYMFGNATTNFLMNPITGTNASHYIKALKEIDSMPEALRRSASYSGYLADELPLRSGYKEIYSKLLADVESKNPLTKIKAVNALFNTPIFKSTNNVETIQRMAEFINQAEKYAREVGKTYDEVIKAAKANNGINKTYRQINRRVEEVLGDYTGRNYYAGKTPTDIANVFLPFYRPFTQAPRQMFNTTVKNPIGTQVGAIVPSRYGSNISKESKETYGIEPYESFGGYPVLAPSGNAPGRVVYNQYHPFSPVIEMMNNPLEVFQGNPFIGSALNIISGKTRYGKEPLPPNTYRMADGSIVSMDNNGNVMPYNPEKQVGDRLRFQGSELLKTFTPVNQLNNFILPNIALLTGKSYSKPADTVPLGQIGDFKIPGIMEGATGRNKETIQEIILPQLGFKYTDTYPERSEEFTPTQVKSNRKKIIKKIDKNNRR